uniref:Uncharacterized protein n=1 Tax=Anguilla anguilla TaxID=7936 RepID=A0A0E9VTR3_ANGAN
MALEDIDEERDSTLVFVLGIGSDFWLVRKKACVFF